MRDGDVENDAAVLAAVGDLVLEGVVEENHATSEPGANAAFVADAESDLVLVALGDLETEVQSPSAVRRTRVRPQMGARVEARDAGPYQAASLVDLARDPGEERVAVEVDGRPTPELRFRRVLETLALSRGAGDYFGRFAAHFLAA